MSSLSKFINHNVLLRYGLLNTTFAINILPLVTQHLNVYISSTNELQLLFNVARRGITSTLLTVARLHCKPIQYQSVTVDFSVDPKDAPEIVAHPLNIRTLKLTKTQQPYLDMLLSASCDSLVELVESSTLANQRLPCDLPNLQTLNLKNQPPPAIAILLHSSPMLLTTIRVLDISFFHGDDLVVNLLTNKFLQLQSLSASVAFGAIVDYIVAHNTLEHLRYSGLPSTIPTNEFERLMRLDRSRMKSLHTYLPTAATITFTPTLLAQLELVRFLNAPKPMFDAMVSSSVAFTRIRTISLNFIAADELTSVAKFLKLCPNIHKLSLFTNSSLADLGQVARALTPHHTLEHLEINDFVEQEALLDDIVLMARACPRLTYLGCGIELHRNTMDSLIEAIIQHPNTINGMVLSRASPSNLLRIINHPNINIINVRMTDDIDENEFKLVLDALSITESNTMYISKLWLMFKIDSDAMLEYLIDKFSNRSMTRVHQMDLNIDIGINIEFTK
ncbi:hypothetical protein SAMD00019534_074510 [Acytostelium subglobosum LB1]|uniref:hypothetical protein n=1 Tax=Acytostelium subglobosum LB1 TaxID=1410327 RepID=UPI0006447C8F|nr:hypothetical protein SAMD00019534_074510 [Acytostelium subglobosum LB1]GAM24276.1 hypothetical protein SAMD00019534_074510 [Acytostelium subglobosum LB1]|eukprot:XP_012752602.1 hypothetical protein SAMD00019534_074510 [Acytostelium subglobosum LB1]